MPNEATQAPEAAAAPEAPEAVAETAHSSPEVTTSTDTNNADPLEGASIDDLLRAIDAANLTGPAAKKADAPAPNPTPPEAKVAPVETLKPVAPETTDDDDEDEETTGQPAVPQTTARNFRLHTEDPKLGTFLKTLKAVQATNPNVNPADVAALVGYAMPGAPAAAAPAVQQSSEPDPRVQALRDQLAQIEKDIEQADTVEYDRKKVRDLQLEQARKERALERMEEAIEAQAVADAEFDAGFMAARAQASALCPEADQDGTPQYDLVFAEVARVKRTNPGLLDVPAYPLDILKRVAAKHPELFPKVVAKPAAVPVTVPALVAKPVPKGQPTSRPVGVVVAGSAPSLTIDSSNAPAVLEALSTEQLIALADRMTAPKKK